MRFPTDLEPEFDWCTFALGATTVIVILGFVVVIVGEAVGWW